MLNNNLKINKPESIEAPYEREILRLKKELAQEQQNHNYTRLAWDTTLQERDKLKEEIVRLRKQEFDLCWGTEADEAGIDKESQQAIIEMAEETFAEIEADKKYVSDLEEELEEKDKEIRDIETKLIIANKELEMLHIVLNMQQKSGII